MQYIYELGGRVRGPGFLCKPYGGKASNQTSDDQLQCVSVGLDAYRRIAGSNDAALIGRMFKGFVDFKIRHDHFHPGTYFATDANPRYLLRSGERHPGKDWQPGSLDWSIG